MNHRTVPKLHVLLVSSYTIIVAHRSCLPKGCLNATNVVFWPIPLGNFFLSNWNPTPICSHNCDIIDIVLVKVDLQSRVMSLRPLIQSPALNDLCGFYELEILACNITTEQLELTTFLGTLEKLRCCTGEGCDALRVCESDIKLGGGSTKLLTISDSGSVDERVSFGGMGGLGCGCSRRWRLVKLRCGNTACWARTRCVLNILPVLGNKSRAKLCELLAKLWDELWSD